MPGMYDYGNGVAAALSEDNAAARPPGTPCSCALLPTSTSADQPHPARWLGAHDRVEVASTDGMVLVGRPWLVSLSSVAEDRTGHWHFGVVTDEGDRVLTPLEDVGSVTPVGVTSPTTLMRRVWDLLADPDGLGPAGLAHFNLPVGAEDEHEYVKVTIERMATDRGCAPWPREVPTPPQNAP